MRARFSDQDRLLSTGHAARVYFATGLVAVLLKVRSPEKILRDFSGRFWRFFLRAQGLEKDRLVRGVRSVFERHPLCHRDRSCLVRSLVMYGFLKPFYPELRIVMGILKESPKDWKGHSWLELDDRPLFPAEKNTHRFERLVVLD